MKISALKVKGFRSLAAVDWQPGDLNILIGPNASGKSNLLRVFEMLSASAREGLEKYVQREGGMEPLVWDGSASSIEFTSDPVARTASYRLAVGTTWNLSDSPYQAGIGS
jgi:predicted ATPase